MHQNDNSEKLNDWAKIITGKHLHISFAKSGLQGYYCIGCSKEMQAVKRKNPDHKDYYRHNATNVDKNTVECTFSSEEYRERLAGNIFARLKAINLPAVYKYPPANEIGVPHLLTEKMRLEASHVKLNISFCENEAGELHWGKNPVIEDENILFKPDVVFFDKANKPILLIEFVTKYKVTDEKKAMLKRLGINTVQIIVPRASEEEIERKLTSHSIVKWVYNEAESSTGYISVQRGNSERIPDIDEEQRKLFEESYACRAAQIGNLVRSIRRSVVAQPYKRAIRQFELEIERVETITRTDHSRLEKLERNYEREVVAELEPTQTEIEQGFIDLEQRQIAFEKNFSSLEERYIRKGEGLIEQTEILDRAIRKQLDEGAGGEALGAVYEAFRETQKDYEIILKTSSKNKKALEDGLNSLKSKISINMNEIKFQNQQILNLENEKLKMLESKLKQKLKVSEKANQEKAEEFKQILKSFELQQLKQLAKEILQETPNCPKELSQYLKLGDFSAVMLKEKTLMRDTSHILSLLELELGKHGRTLNWFLSKYEK